MSDTDERIHDYASLRHYIRQDSSRRSPAGVGLAWLWNPILRFTLALRVNEYLLNKGFCLPIRILPLIYYKRLSIRLGFSIPLNVFQEGLVIVHIGTIVVSPLARVGRNCRIHVCTNIGATLSESGESSAPRIGHDCYVAPGAKLYGPIEIGDNCKIGANAVVGRSFPSGCVIAGVPAKVISRNLSVER